MFGRKNTSRSKLRRGLPKQPTTTTAPPGESLPVYRSGVTGYRTAPQHLDISYVSLFKASIVNRDTWRDWTRPRTSSCRPLPAARQACIDHLIPCVPLFNESIRLVLLL